MNCNCMGMCGACDNPSVPQASSACPICTKDTPHDHARLLDPATKFPVPRNKQRWIGVDFDGTLAYDPPDRNDPYTLGEPIIPMVNRVKGWLANGYEVRILTARMHKISFSAGCYRDLVKMERMLEEWCEKHIGTKLKCTNEKDGLMEVLWDDRAVRVIDGIPVLSASPAAPESAKPELGQEWEHAKFVQRVLEAGNQATQKDRVDAYWMVRQFRQQVWDKAAKPEQQAQAGEPREFESGKDVQIRRLESALASKEDEYQRLHAHCLAYKEAITKKDAALKACVEALKNYTSPGQFGGRAPIEQTTISQAEEALK